MKTKESVFKNITRLLIWLLHKLNKSLIIAPIKIIPDDDTWHGVSMNITFWGKRKPTQADCFIDGISIKNDEAIIL